MGDTRINRSKQCNEVYSGGKSRVPELRRPSQRRECLCLKMRNEGLTEWKGGGKIPSRGNGTYTRAHLRVMCLGTSNNSAWANYRAGFRVARDESGHGGRGQTRGDFSVMLRTLSFVLNVVGAI